MKDFKGWLNESVLPTIQRATDILKDRKDQKYLVRSIQELDPYQDKRFAPIIAGWIRDHDITPQEHAGDVKQFKELHRRLKDLRVPATNRERAEKVRDLLSKKPEDFARHYSDLQSWNAEASGLLDPDRDLSLDGLPVVMRHNGYTMYRISNKKHCKVPLVKNSMSWCVTKDSFGQYGGPPYYPVVRDRDMKPFAMIIPAYFDEDPRQAVRNADNDGRLSPTDLAKIRPLVQHVLPLDKHQNPYIKGIHRIRTGLPNKPTAEEAYKLIEDYAMEPGEWPEGELAISLEPRTAYLYALNVIKGRWPLGEPAISQNADRAYFYAKNVLKGRFPAGEGVISQDNYFAYLYKKYVDKGFPILQ